MGSERVPAMGSGRVLEQGFRPGCSKRFSKGFGARCSSGFWKVFKGQSLVGPSGPGMTFGDISE